MVQFRFSQDAPDAQMMNDFQQLGGMNEQQLGQFIDIIISFFAGQQPDQLMGDVNEFSSNHGINPNALRNIIRFVSKIFLYNFLYRKKKMTPIFSLSKICEIKVGQWKTQKISIQLFYLIIKYYLGLSSSSSREPLELISPHSL